ncbi:MAG: sugar phosphate nucleotidyltransferase [Spirochaetia bacterium]|jgi:mannose-1-phosphate guanylyltransferase/mannose-6-phosphate isomerase|nr:sugar phosphate nucleotidyltransferase [Spirochaetia bacterium]
MIENVFILAGGSGTRLWPASNKKNPKQFLEAKDGKSLILLTVERALLLSSEVCVFIITLKDQMEGIIAECNKIESGLDRIFILPETVAKNTAPAIAACSSFLIEQGKGQERVLVLPADHLIEPFGSFKNDVEEAGKLADKDYLVTFGIKPTYPSTGYGYIEAGAKELNGFSVSSFKEKPSESTAEEFIEQGNYFWNSGMFVFKLDRFWEELEKGSPLIAEQFSEIGKDQNSRIKDRVTVIMESEITSSLYKESPKDSIDYGVMEKCRRSAMVPASFIWNDIGSWDEMSELDIKEGEKFYNIESSNNFVLADLPVVLCGVEDLVVVQKNGALLICKKGKGQLVKDAVELLKEKNKLDIL